MHSFPAISQSSLNPEPVQIVSHSRNNHRFSPVNRFMEPLHLQRELSAPLILMSPTRRYIHDNPLPKSLNKLQQVHSSPGPEAALVHSRSSGSLNPCTTSRTRVDVAVVQVHCTIYPETQGETVQPDSVCFSSGVYKELCPPSHVRQPPSSCRSAGAESGLQS